MAETPEFAPIPVWRAISGMGRSRTYEELGAGNLRAIKCGGRLLIDVRHGLAFLRALPAAEIRAYKSGHGRSHGADTTPEPAPVQRRDLRGRPRKAK